MRIIGTPPTSPQFSTGPPLDTIGSSHPTSARHVPSPLLVKLRVQIPGDLDGGQPVFCTDVYDVETYLSSRIMYKHIHLKFKHV